MSARRVRAYIGLGANVGDARATLISGVGALAGLTGARLRGVSRLYATVPVGVTDQPDFHNAVVALEVDAGPDPATGALRLLTSLKNLEHSFGRSDRGRWGPRELDLDLLVFGRALIAIELPPSARSIHDVPIAAAVVAAAATVGADATVGAVGAASGKLLVVPHASAAARLFVLAPLADLAPGLVPPGWGRSVETARRLRLEIEGHDAVRVIGAWDASARAWGPSTLEPPPRI